jgi:putative iron-regulated protein
MKKWNGCVALSLVASLLALQPGCGSDDGAPDDTSGGAGGEGGGGGALEERALDARDTYAAIVLRSYEDSLTLAHALNDAIVSLVDEPSQAHLDAARAAWLAAREPYLQTEVYRFYGGPIDDEEDGPEGLINAWPLDEAYIDYVEGDAEAGIINDPSIDLNAETLMELNEQGGEANIATGYHAIEFLLWGQDQSEDGPGDRPHTDYSTAENADRRGEYLKLVSTLLIDHLQQLVDAWKPGEANYRDEWEALGPDEALRRMLTGMLTLSGFETGGERIETAIASGAQEDEHSCFSDNTHRDMIQDIVGVKNVWTGSYVAIDDARMSGTGIRAVVGEADETLRAQVDELLDEALAKANALQPPFDQEIRLDNEDGQARVIGLAQSLRKLERALTDVVRTLDLDVSTMD